MTHILFWLVGLRQVMENLNQVLHSAVTALRTSKGGFTMSRIKTEPNHFSRGFEHDFGWKNSSHATERHHALHRPPTCHHTLAWGQDIWL